MVKSPHLGASASVHSVPCSHIRAKVPGVFLHSHPGAPALGLMTQVSGNRININPACLCQAAGQPRLLLSSYPCLPGCHWPPAWALHGHQHMTHSHRVSEKFLRDVNEAGIKRQSVATPRGPQKHQTHFLLPLSTRPQTCCVTLGKFCLSLDLCSLRAWVMGLRPC